MKTCFMDTNLFIRYLVNDDPGKADRVEKLLEQATSGKIRLVTADLVIAEVIWVLESAYGLKNAEITPMVKGILATPGIEVTNAELVGRSLDYYESLNIDEFVKSLKAHFQNKGTEENRSLRIYLGCSSFTGFRVPMPPAWAWKPSLLIQNSVFGDVGLPVGTRGDDLKRICWFEGRGSA